MTNVCTIASTDLYFEIYDLWMVFAKTELGDPGSALPALQLMPPCTSEKNRTYDWVFSPQLIQEILPPPIFPPDGHLLHGKHWPLSLSLCQLTLCQCTMGKVSTIFTWTTKRDVCCDKTKKIEMDLHVGHPFTINTGIIILGCMYLLLNRNMKFYSRSSNTVLHRTITPFFFIIQS